MINVEIGNMILCLIAMAAMAVYFCKLALVSIPPEVDFKHFRLLTAQYDDYRIKPFKINISEYDLIDLKEKLLSTRHSPPSLEGVGFTYGTNAEYLKSFLKYWKTEYNWKEREPYLNQFPQFTTQIGGLNIHFIHVKPNEASAKGKEILPLLLIHGWPVSLRALYKLIPMLTTAQESNDFVFEVVAPSIPGNGFSEASPISGLDAAQISIMFHRLMCRLGLEKYYIHASDAGSIIGQPQAIIFEKNVLGYHSNLCLAMSFTSLAYFFHSFFLRLFFAQEYEGDTLVQDSWITFDELAIFDFIYTSPDTLGIALTDSPVGLAANILENISAWSNYNLKNRTDGGLESFDKNDLLDIIMIYWLTKSITPSMRIWRETFDRNAEFVRRFIIMRSLNVPAGCIWFENELSFLPKHILSFTFTNLITFTEQEGGGHFPSIGKPLLLSDDIWNFVKEARIKVWKEVRFLKFSEIYKYT